MRVVVGGASGMIGRGLVERLRQRGDRVIVLVRREPAGGDEVRWDPSTAVLDADVLVGADAVVSLSGASIAKLPWTRAHRAAILASRIQATRAITQALHERTRLDAPVPVLVSGSATGIYGDRPGEELTEESAPGGGFLAGVVRAWEAAALAAPEGTRVALARTGLVVGPEGATAPLRLAARFGLGGPLGSGRQHWPWIALDDELGALLHLLDTEVRGPVNLVGPTPATASEVGRAVAADAHRPYWLPVPELAIRGALGAAGRELLLSDQLVRPVALEDSGYAFRRPTIGDAVAAVAG